MSILNRFRVIARFSSKLTNFNPPHLHLSPPYGVIPFEFRNELWCQKTRVKGLSCGVICAILRLAVLIQYRSVTDTHTHRHTTTAYTALSKASRGKNCKSKMPVTKYRRLENKTIMRRVTYVSGVASVPTIVSFGTRAVVIIMEQLFSE